MPVPEPGAGRRGLAHDAGCPVEAGLLTRHPPSKDP